MRNVLLLVATIFIISQSYGQSVSEQKGGTIYGKIIDSLSRTPLEYATITLQQKQTAKTINGATTDKNGSFIIHDVKPGAYRLVVESIGFEKYETDLSMTGASEQNINTISLNKKQVTLQGVTVTAMQKLIDNKIDKLVYNAEKDITSQSGAATDLLKKVPQVSVDADGNVQLAGTSGIRFLINGKPSTAFGANVADVLQSIPASQIKSIEVVTSPGAKYDAQGMGGIINIILKESKAQGINGNLALAAGTRADNGSFTFNARKNDLGFNAFINGNLRPAFATPFRSDRTSSDTAAGTDVLLHQDGSIHYNRHGFQTGVGIDWTYKKRNNFTGSVSYNKFGNDGDIYYNQSQLINRHDNGVNVSDYQTQSYTYSSFDFHSVDASLNYKRTFTKEDRELEIGVNTSKGFNTVSSDNYVLAIPGNTKTIGTISNNPGSQRQTEIRIDYVEPINKDTRLGLGAKYSSGDINSNSNGKSFKPVSQEYLTDIFLTNALMYNQKVYALYSELSMPIKDIVDVKFGGRYERTEISSYFSNARQQVAIPGYNTIVPSIYFSKKLESNQQVKLGYTKRIERPDYGDLNPYVNTSDPKNLTTGNPYLKPEIGHRMELSYMRPLGSGSFMATLFYRINENDIQPFVRYYNTYKVGDSVYSNVSVTSRENIGIEKNMGVNLFADMKAGSKLSIRSSLFVFRRHTINQQDIGYNSTSFNYRFNTNASYQFSNTLAAEFFGNFNSSRHEAQGIYPSFVSYTIAVRKQFWNKNGSIALTANNPFSKYLEQKTDIFGPNFQVISYRQLPFRSFGISFSWKFGKLEFKKEKEDDNSTPEMPQAG